MDSFNIRTPNHDFNMECYHKFVDKGKVVVRKNFFDEMCKNGCKNYKKKYSCPPYSPTLDNLLKGFDGLYIVLFLCNLNQIDSTEYNKLRIANVSTKSRLIKLMRYLEGRFKTFFLSTGSCNLCKPCKLKLNLPCAHPDKRRYSLESLGVDCDKLTRDLFNINLLWYKNKKSPKYACAVGGLVCYEKDVPEIKKGLKDGLDMIFNEGSL